VVEALDESGEVENSTQVADLRAIALGSTNQAWYDTWEFSGCSSICLSLLWKLRATCDFGVV
jgi:hypothetical protein